MASTNQASRFCYDSEANVEFSANLDIFVHHARNIHNICIYNNQDVYAKFSLTYNPDETISTRVAVGGGKNPDFNEKLEIKVNQSEAVLKCEIWMLSRAKHLLEDQLLGFALVPISLISSQGGKISSQNFSLSSTDLLHSPAGTVQLSFSLTSNSLAFPLNSSVNPFPSFSGSSSIASEVVLLDPNEYARVEFPDINAATEDKMIISQYFTLNSSSSSVGSHHGSFLQLLQRGDVDYEMMGTSLEENNSSPSGSKQNSETLSSTTTCISDDRNTGESSSTDVKSRPEAEREQGNVGDDLGGGGHGEERNGVEHKPGFGDMRPVFIGPVGSVDVEAEQAAMQQQIVDMYMKSMQQFTESLSKMKLPMDLDPNRDEKGQSHPIQIDETNSKMEVEHNKKDGPRVFYGSRAFF